MKKYLITGGSGFLGQELISRLIGEVGDADILVLARNEGNLVKLKEKFPDIKIMLGDVSDPYICDRAMQGVDGVYHLAALKHVGLAEENVREAIHSNIPIALLEATRKYKPKFIIGISTDKAASRKGVYGSTKFLMERLFAEYEKLNSDTKYRIVRYGNVIYSTGSVLCKWKEKILKMDPVMVTDLEATRFFWTVEQAVDLIFSCLANATDSTPYVTKMKSISIGDLLDAMLIKYTPVNEIGMRSPVKVIGLQSGENMHEIIDENGPDSSQVERFTHEEIMQMI